MKKSIWFLLTLMISMNVVSAETDQLYQSGLYAIEKKDFKTAISDFEKVVKIEPDNSEYYRWLGHAYGLQAEQTSWFKAIGLAKKTRISFEKAVELDPENINALVDLREFYKQAPGFLGGGKDKADLITEKLKALGHNVDQEKESD